MTLGQSLKPRSCKAPGCDATFTPRSGFQKVCSAPCALALARQKGQKDAAKAQRKAKTEGRKRLMTRADWIKKVTAVFNKWVRLRDAELPCISCGRTNEEVAPTDGWKVGGAWDCGHWKSVGAHENLRFVEDNAHKQCKSCNAGSAKYARKGGTVATGYRERLIARIGPERVAAVETDHEARHYTIADLQALETLYKAKLRELQA